jgi:hypothetical protein
VERCTAYDISCDVTTFHDLAPAKRVPRSLGLGAASDIGIEISTPSDIEAISRGLRPNSS